MREGDLALQIVPYLPGTLDGVGDYALNLARALSSGHGITTTFLVAAPRSSGDPGWREEYKVLHGLDPAAADDLAATHRNVILHYVNYGYQRRGVPFRLRRFAGGLKARLGGRWVTTFHELYASGPPWSSVFWVRPFQVAIARDLIDLSDACVVSNVPIKEEIAARRPAKQIHILPVMSNFGEPELAPVGERSRNRWVICGGTELIARSLALFDSVRKLIPEHWAPAHLDVVGGRADPIIGDKISRLKQSGELAVHHYPEVTPKLASEVLRQSCFGWIDYFGSGDAWPGMVLKSTAFAAMCAHGVIPVLSHREGPVVIDGDALPGPYYLTSNRQNFPGSSEDIVAIATGFYEWYHRQADSGHAADVYASALR
jgi:hypothetical protein